MAERLSPLPRERGFTIMEVLIALVVLLVGMAGILSLQLSSVQATSFSRHATEASILAEDRMEALRTESFLLLAACTEASPCIDEVDATRAAFDGAYYRRSWYLEPGDDPGDPATLVVDVFWKEHGGPEQKISLTTQRKR